MASQAVVLAARVILAAREVARRDPTDLEADPQVPEEPVLAPAELPAGVLAMVLAEGRLDRP